MTNSRGRRIKVRGSNINDILDRHAQIKARLVRSIGHEISTDAFKNLSYTDATMMLVETDITLAMKRAGEEGLFRSNPHYYEIVWKYFGARFIDPEYLDPLLADPQRLFATMMHAVTILGDIPAADLYKDFMDEDRMDYCGVKGSFQSIRVPNSDRYERAFVVDHVTSMEKLYEASLRMCCVAIDAYVVNFLNGWGDYTPIPAYDCMRAYLKEYGIRDVYSPGDLTLMYDPDVAMETTYDDGDISDRPNIPYETLDLAFSGEGVSVQNSTNEFRGLNWPFEQIPPTIDRNDDETNWRNSGINRLLP